MLNTKKGLIIDCSNGISGDMSVGALLGLGANQEMLIKKLKDLNVAGFSIQISQLEKHDELVWDYDVLLDADFHAFTNQRNIFDIHQIINHSALNFFEKELSKTIFNIAAKAGARAHNVPLENFFFHEIGAVDSIADIIGIAICLNEIIQQHNLSDIFLSNLSDGYGPVTLRNGKTLPIPVPAVQEILSEYQIPYHRLDIFGELITPTGASFAAFIHLKMTSQIPNDYQIIQTAFGNGKRKNDSKSILKMEIIEWSI